MQKEKNKSVKAHAGEKTVKQAGARKRYSKPELIVHGQLERMTAGSGAAPVEITF